LTLEANLLWTRKPPLGQAEEDLFQSLAYRISSYFVKTTDFEVIWSWMQNNCSGVELASPAHSCCIFFKEYFWAPAYKFFEDSYYYGHETWQEFNPLQTNSINSPKVMPTTENYLWEYETQEHISDNIPCKALFTFFNLISGQNTGEWISPDGEIICKEIRLKPGEKTCFFVRKDRMTSFLARKRLRIIWSCLGNKSAYNSHCHFSIEPVPVEIAGAYTLVRSKISGISKEIRREKT